MGRPQEAERGGWGRGLEGPLHGVLGVYSTIQTGLDHACAPDVQVTRT